MSSQPVDIQLRIDQLDLNSDANAAYNLTGSSCRSCSGTIVKRNDVISWEDYFMSVAVLSSKRSKDPVTQVGACVVSSENKILSTGYNGMPVGCSDDELPWSKDPTDPLKNKNLYVCHAEMNAIVYSECKREPNCRLYTTLFPCNECAKIIIQAGIKTVIYLKDKPDKAEMQASKRLFDLVSVQYRQFLSDVKEVKLSLE